MTINLDRNLGKREVRKSTGGSLSLAPIAPSGTTLDITSATITLYSPAGVSVSSPTPTILSGSISWNVPSGLTYDEDYTAHVAYSVSGSAVEKLKVVSFDVVYEVWFDEPLVSYGDIVSTRPNIAGVLQNLGDQLGESKEEMAYQYILQAHTQLDNWIRGKCSTDQQVRARAIISKERLLDIERLLAVSNIYSAVSDGSPDDANTLIAQAYLKDANTRFLNLGNFKYDADNNGIPDTDVPVFSRSIQLIYK